MTGADGRLSDAARLLRLRDTGMLDDGEYPSLDRLARAAAHQLRAMRAQVSLVAADHRVVAGRAGPPLGHSLCAMVVDLDGPLLVSDARTDERVTGHPAVADGVIAYAGFPVRSADGHSLGTFCVIDERPREWEPRELLLIEDLAAAAEAEIALRTANRRLAAEARRVREVLGGTHDAYVSMDAFGIVIGWNLAAERLFGYSADDADGRPLADLIIPERFRDAHSAALARLHSGGASTLAGNRVELWAADNAGREFPVEMMLQIVGDGPEPAYHAFVHEISDRAAERRQLEHERMFLQALLDSLDAGVAACDEQGRLTLFNRAMRDMHQTDIQPLERGRWPVAFDLYQEDGSRFAADEIPLVRACAGETVVGVPMVVAPPGAPPQTYLANARPIESSDGRRLGAVVAMHDVTAQRRAESLRERLLADQQEQNRQLRHLDRLKDELIALVSHELRNPLGAIRGYSETLLDDPALTGEQRHLAEVIARRSTHMQVLVDDLLDLARLEAGKLPIDPKPVPAALTVRDVIETHHHAAEAKSLDLTVDVPRHLLVHADPFRLRQVLDNLVSNAIKYTPAGGAVTITARQVTDDPDDDLVTIAVADTGIGIPADQYGNLFERFFRAGNAVREGIKGTGLGLAITKAIVEAHGGTLTAEPAPGGGTTFTVTLRAA